MPLKYSKKRAYPLATWPEGIIFVAKYLNKHSKNLIFGVTGSGKTEIYLRLIAKVLSVGKSAIVLVPEISLTPQMVDRFLARFGEKIAILHSKLSVGERFDAFNHSVPRNRPRQIGVPNRPSQAHSGIWNYAEL